MAKIFLLVFIVGFLALKVKSFDDDKDDFIVAKRGAESDGDDDDGVLRSSRTRSCTNPPKVSCAILRRSSSSRSRPFFTSQRSRTQYPHGRRAYYHLRDNRYTLRGATRIRCNRGRWTRGPTCIRKATTVSCPTLRISCGTCTKSGSTARCSANDGWELVGSTRRTCQSDGTWSGNSPQCRRKERLCSNPPYLSCAECRTTPPNARSRGRRVFTLADAQRNSRRLRSFRPGKKVYYHVRPGKTLHGGAVIECKDGNWTSVPTCGQPRQNPTGNRADSVTRRCANPPYVSCGICVTENPNSPSQGRSRRIPNSVDALKNQRRTMVFEPGRTVYYKLKNADWVFQGSTQIVCHSDGTWSNPPFCDRPYCDGLPQIGNGTCTATDPEGVKMTERANCTCNTGFSLLGFSEVTCKNATTSSWGQKPKCVPTDGPGCTRAPRIRNGRCDRISKPPYPFQKYMKKGDFVKCNCLPGYGIKVATAKYRPEDYEQYRPVIHRGDNYGDSFIQATTIGTCLDRNKFKDLPRCVNLPDLARPCQYPPDVVGSTCHSCVDFIQSNVTFYPGDTVRYQCGGNYRLQGNPMVHCRSNGYWTRTPRCLEIPRAKKCRNVPEPKNGYCDSHGENRVEPGEEIECKCDNGYKLEGNPIIMCQDDGSWSSTGPTCTFIVVENPPMCTLDEIDNAILNATCESVLDDGSFEFTEGQKVRCFCDGENVFEMQGSREVTCNGASGWSSSRPTCRRLGNCGNVPDVDSGFCWSDTNFGTVFKEDEEIQCGCDADFTISDNAANGQTIKCQANDNWSATPTCTSNSERTYDCDPINLPNGHCDGDKPGYMAGERVTCKCDGSDKSRRAYCRSRGRGWRRVPTCP